MKSATEKLNTTEELRNYVLHDAAIKFLATEELRPTAKVIYGLLPSPENQKDGSRISLATLYRFCAANFPNCLSLKLLRVYASTKPRYNENMRESAIRRLNALLSNHRKTGEPLLAFFVIQELQPLLISCLEEQGIREDTFKVLAEVTYHVAFEVCNCHNAVWFELSEFISSRAETEFKKAVYMFKWFCIIPSDGDDSMIPLLENIIPPILNWLQPSQLCRENNWAIAFTGAFCAAIHLIETPQVGLVDYIVDQMLRSVSELVKRGMEVGFVRRALREVEMLVWKQLYWYCDSEYDFVTNLIRRMNQIKGMKNETKMVLWRIQMAVEIRVKKRKTTKKPRVTDSSLVPKAKQVYMIPSHQEAATLISTLLQRQESQENRSTESIYIFCWDYFPNGLVEMIFDVYQRATHTPEVRSKSIYLLCALLTHFRENDMNLSGSALRKIKPRLISAILIPETRESDIKILAKVVYLVASEVFESHNRGWEELGVCIAWAANEDLRKAFYLFRDLPPVYDSFLFCILKRLFPEILTLLNPEEDFSKDWSLALQTGFKMGIHLLESMRWDLAWNVLYAMLMSANKLVRQDLQEILQQGLEELRCMVNEHADHYKYDTDQHKFALGLVSMMARMTGTGRQTKEAAREIYQILKTNETKNKRLKSA